MRTPWLLLLTLSVLYVPSIQAQQSGEIPSAPSPSFNSGIKLRGNYHVNRSAVQTASERPTQEDGYGFGLEINGKHLGIALYGFGSGRLSEYEAETSPVIVVAEANYFVPIERLRLAPYAGVHTALGEFTKTYFDDPHFPRPQDGVPALGYQFGVRFKPIPVIGLDAQWRRQSAFAATAQDPSLERNQVLVGITLF
jgi:hypothetical protein